MLRPDRKIFKRMRRTNNRSEQCAVKTLTWEQACADASLQRILVGGHLPCLGINSGRQDRAKGSTMNLVLILAAMVLGSEHANAICGLCADVGQSCGDECAKHEMEHCQDCA